MALSEPKFRTEFLFFYREKWPEVRRKRDLHEPPPNRYGRMSPSLICYSPPSHGMPPEVYLLGQESRLFELPSVRSRYL